MTPARRKGSRRAASSASAARLQWNVGDLVLAKIKGFPAWPAMITTPEKWGYTSDRNKLFVYFYGTEQLGFCGSADVEAFTENKKISLLSKRQGKGAVFLRAVDEIVYIYEQQKSQYKEKFNSGDEGTAPSVGNSEGSIFESLKESPELSSRRNHSEGSIVESLDKSPKLSSPRSCDVFNHEETPTASVEANLHDMSTETGKPTGTISALDQPRQTPLAAATYSRRRPNDIPQERFDTLRVVSVQSDTVEGNLHDMSTETGEPTGTIFALDRPRQTPLAAATYSRKRPNDASPERFDVHRVVSVQRSESSSDSYLYRFEPIPEACLPPSKRLRRALEAMYANIAEEFDSNNRTDSPKKISHVLTDGMVGSPNITEVTIF